MADTRKLELDVELINKLIPQLEADLELSKREVETARIQYEIAKSKYEKALDHIRQMRGESSIVELAKDIDAKQAIVEVGSSNKSYGEQADSYNQGEYHSASSKGTIIDESNEDETLFWKTKGFQWRQFLPNFIGKENRFMNIGDVLSALNLAEKHRRQIYPTISSALSVLAKDKKRLVSFTIPDVKGQLYGLPSFFEEGGKVKHEYVDDLLKRRFK
ncbi:hypothetical protein GCM10028808_18830 [Spirosoma migulaei]